MGHPLYSPLRNGPLQSLVVSNHYHFIMLIIFWLSNLGWHSRKEQSQLGSVIWLGVAGPAAIGLSSVLVVGCAPVLSAGVWEAQAILPHVRCGHGKAEQPGQAEFSAPPRCQPLHVACGLPHSHGGWTPSKAADVPQRSVPRGRK